MGKKIRIKIEGMLLWEKTAGFPASVSYLVTKICSYVILI